MKKKFISLFLISAATIFMTPTVTTYAKEFDDNLEIVGYLSDTAATPSANTTGTSPTEAAGSVFGTTAADMTGTTPTDTFGTTPTNMTGTTPSNTTGTTPSNAAGTTPSNAAGVNYGNYTTDTTGTAPTNTTPSADVNHPANTTGRNYGSYPSNTSGTPSENMTDSARGRRTNTSGSYMENINNILPRSLDNNTEYDSNGHIKVSKDTYIIQDGDDLWLVMGNIKAKLDILIYSDPSHTNENGSGSNQGGSGTADINQNNTINNSPVESAQQENIAYDKNNLGIPIIESGR